MAIDGLDEEAVRIIISEALSPARAISSPEHLKGRDKNIKQIERDLAIPGRIVFVYGDRGVGKTSLALTTATLHQSSDALPITVSCDSSTQLYQLISDILNQALARHPGEIKKTTREAGFSFKFLTGKKASEVLEGEVPPIKSINECVDIIRFLPVIHSRQPLIVIDEFDRISKKEDKRAFAEFFKKIGDDEIESRFIICGIGSSLDALLGEHLSVARNFVSVKLERLTHDARWEIIEQASERLGIKFDRGMVMRIGQISDGFPHYVHLLGEKIIWAAFDDNEVVTLVKPDHFSVGLREAILSAEALPRLAYATATQKYKDDYKEVLWAIADGPHLERQTADIYENSYQQIMRERPGRRALDRQAFYNRVNRLKTASHGRIIESPKRSWYKFSDNVVRGYVRLEAQNDGIEVGDEFFSSK